jgi:hypothetical protein
MSFLLAPTILLRLRLQNSIGQPIELRHQALDSRHLKQFHVVGDGFSYNIAETLIVVWSRGECMIGGLGKLWVLPEELATLTELLLAELLESGDAVFVCNLVHLGVLEKLFGGANRGLRHTFLATETIAVTFAMYATCMVPTGGSMAGAPVIIIAGMRKDVLRPSLR